MYGKGQKKFEVPRQRVIASGQSKQDTIRGVQIQAGAIYICIYIYLLVMCSVSTVMASERGLSKKLVWVLNYKCLFTAKRVNF